MYANAELRFEPEVTIEIMPDLSDGEKVTTKETNFNEQQKDLWQATCKPVQILFSENGKHPTDWRKMSNHISCISYKTVNDVNETDSSFLCVECEDDQIVVATCCDEPSTNKCFAIRIIESVTECPTCKSQMIPCCDQFKPKSIIDDNI